MADSSSRQYLKTLTFSLEAYNRIAQEVHQATGVQLDKLVARQPQIALTYIVQSFAIIMTDAPKGSVVLNGKPLNGSEAIEAQIAKSFEGAKIVEIYTVSPDKLPKLALTITLSKN